jgi:hypothetical protein
MGERVTEDELRDIERHPTGVGVSRLAGEVRRLRGLIATVRRVNDTRSIYHGDLVTEAEAIRAESRPDDAGSTGQQVNREDVERAFDDLEGWLKQANVESVNWLTLRFSLFAEAFSERYDAAESKQSRADIAAKRTDVATTLGKLATLSPAELERETADPAEVKRALGDLEAWLKPTSLEESAAISHDPFLGPSTRADIVATLAEMERQSAKPAEVKRAFGDLERWLKQASLEQLRWLIPRLDVFSGRLHRALEASRPETRVEQARRRLEQMAAGRAIHKERGDAGE